MQKNVLDQKVWVEGKVHRKRRQRGLGRLTPIGIEVVNVGRDAVAA